VTFKLYENQTKDCLGKRFIFEVYGKRNITPENKKGANALIMLTCAVDTKPEYDKLMLLFAAVKVKHVLRESYYDEQTNSRDSIQAAVLEVFKPRSFPPVPHMNLTLANTVSVHASHDSNVSANCAFANAKFPDENVVEVDHQPPMLDRPPFDRSSYHAVGSTSHAHDSHGVASTRQPALEGQRDLPFPLPFLFPANVLDILCETIRETIHDVADDVISRAIQTAFETRRSSLHDDLSDPDVLGNFDHRHAMHSPMAKQQKFARNESLFANSEEDASSSNPPSLEQPFGESESSTSPSNASINQKGATKGSKKKAKTAKKHHQQLQHDTKPMVDHNTLSPEMAKVTMAKASSSSAMTPSPKGVGDAPYTTKRAAK
jgi:hypothetical protein